MAGRARLLSVVLLTTGLAATGMASGTSGALAAPAPGAGPGAHALQVPHKTRHAHLSTVLDRLADPAVARGSARAQADSAGTPQSGPGSLLRADHARLLVEIRVAQTDPGTLAALSGAGAHVTFTSAANHRLTAAVAPTDLAKLSDVAGVQYVSQIYEPMIAGAPQLGPGQAAPAAAVPAGCNPIISEGDTMLNAAAARTRYGIDGTGVTVGVLSDSFARVATPKSQSQDVASGDLPGAANPCGHLTPVNVLDDTEDPSFAPADEGRAMAQTVHDLAPGANLSFATAFTGEDRFAANIAALRNAGAKVIVDDVSYFDEPMYQDGVISNAVSAATAAGVSYFSAAANNNMVVNGQNVGSYEATNGYRPTACPAMTIPAPFTETLLDCHNFKTSGTTPDSTYGMTVQPGGDVDIDMQWAQPMFGVTTDFDLMLLNSAGTVIAASELDNLATGSSDPFELLQWTNTAASAQSVRLVVGRFAGLGTPRFKFVHMENGATGITSVEYGSSVGGDVVGPTIFGHNGAATAGSVAALPYNDANTPEYYSSHGPVTLLFGPVNGIIPALRLGAPQVLAKPDFAATDCVRNTFFGFQDGSGTWRFCGTSDAAPHAAAVAALLLQRKPTSTPAQVLSSLAATAAPVNNGSMVSTGAGRLNADGEGDATTTTVSASAAVTQPGQSVTFTATVAGIGATKTGTVKFTDGATSLATVSLDGTGHAALTTGGLAAGIHHITASYSGDAANMPSTSTTTADVAVDGTAPVVSVTAPASLYQLSQTITASYSATDPISGVAGYDVRYRVAPWNGPFGAYNETTWQNITTTSVSLAGTPGREYCFSVRARDRAANVSAWSPDRCTVLPLDDRSLTTITSGWNRVNYSTTYLGTATRTTVLNAKLQLASAQVDRMALVVTQCTTCGNIAIYLNGVLWQTVNTHTSTVHNQVILALPSFSLRTTTIVIANATSGKDAIIDGLAIART